MLFKNELLWASLIIFNFGVVLLAYRFFGKLGLYAWIGIAGYIIKRVGIKNIMNMLKQKEIIPPSISNLINEFTSRRKSEE
ncbi:unnamed protein product [marine sediment metagenome]|uniref:Uncharacterized protein n=1 Tax=marine sediment metagenome TaxID=412755 RepID=X1A3N0_9ZZZZ